MPHKVTTIKRYRISDDVLLLILEKLNPLTLYRTCQAFERIYVLVLRYNHLKYRYELGLVGMKDGPVPYTTCPPKLRQQILMAYKMDWPRLKWDSENQVRPPAMATKISVTGGFLYYVANQGLYLLELPSSRTRKSPSQTRKFMYSTPDASCVLVDPMLSLIVISNTIIDPNGQIRLRLKLRNLWTLEKHQLAGAATYECLTPVAQPVRDVTMSIYETKMICTLHFASGLSKHLLLDWHKLQAMWLDEQDIVLLNPYLLLGVKKVHNKVSLYLYNISKLDKVFLEREYELPPRWNNSVLQFVHNSALNSEHSIPCSTGSALFYSDPTARVLMLSAKSEGSETYWLFISESFFRPSHEDRRPVPWPYWNQFCLIKELQAGMLVGSPQIVGSRILYLEKDGTYSASGHARTRLKVIDFAPYADIPVASPIPWTLVGRYSILRPREYQRDFSSGTTNNLAVEGMCVTDDNIVLLLENHSDFKHVNILTFGLAPPSKAIRQEIQYH